MKSRELFCFFNEKKYSMFVDAKNPVEIEKLIRQEKNSEQSP